MVRVASVVCLALLAAGCQTVRTNAPFDSKAAAYVLEKGTGTIQGEAFLRRDQGVVVTGAGERVYLFPATDYAVARFETMFGGGRRAYSGSSVEEAPDDYHRLRRETRRCGRIGAGQVLS